MSRGILGSMTVNRQTLTLYIEPGVRTLWDAECTCGWASASATQDRARISLYDHARTHGWPTDDHIVKP